MTYKFDFAVVFASFDILAKGCWLTLQMSLAAIALAMAIALTAALVRRVGPAPLRWIAKVYVEAIRNTPFLIQIFIIYFGLPTIGIRMDPTTAAIIGLGINGGAYCSEIIRGGIDSIHKGQIEAALALSLTPFQVFLYVILKPALRAVYPALGSQFILLLLTSSIVSSISANELTQAAQHIESKSFRSFEVYIVVTGLYLAMTMALSWLLKGVFRLSFRYPA